MSLRELKKERTRRLIADTAWALFAERGFDNVTVAEVARAAEVAEATVFNYFPTKEDLFYARLEAFGDRLVEAVSSRSPGTTALAAVRGHLLEDGGLLARVETRDLDALERLRTVNRVIGGSTALQARERLAIAGHTDSLAVVLATETGAASDDIRPRVAANALIAIQHALIEYVRERVLVDADPTGLAADVRRLGNRGFALLEEGLGEYAPKRS